MKMCQLLLDCLKILRLSQFLSKANPATKALQKYPVYNREESGTFCTFLEQKT